MASYLSDPEFFRLGRSLIEPVGVSDFTTLYRSVMGAVNRKPSMDYADPARPGVYWRERRSDTDVVTERYRFGRTNDGRLVDARLFPEGMQPEASVGVIALVGIAPESHRKAENLFVMSIGERSHWVTDYDDGRSIQADELASLIVDLDSLPIA